ncbi:MAG TPA: hypothetical protein VLA39_09180, partial [Marinobacterium sp.]|nr:hypothetical protein [Marinobacterium sp.]
ILRAALAPAEPSGQDRQVAAQARAMIAEAQAELSQGAGERERAESAIESPDEKETLTASADESEDVQDDIALKKERAAESLAEFQQTLKEVNQRLVEVNKRLTELGVLEELYAPGAVLETTA